jgi:hypothetical protein
VAVHGAGAWQRAPCCSKGAQQGSRMVTDGGGVGAEPVSAHRLVSLSYVIIPPSLSTVGCWVNQHHKRRYIYGTSLWFSEVTQC